MDQHLRDIDKLEFVKQQLALYAGEKKDDGDHVKILCPYHSEKTPSASINLSPHGSPGWLHCFGCKASERYDDWAPLVGLEPYKKGPPKEKFAHSILMQYANDEPDEETGTGTPKVEIEKESRLDRELPFKKWKLKHWPLPTGKLWRSISTDLLIQLGGRGCFKYSEAFSRWGSTKFIDLPVMINGEQKGMFLARLKKHETEASYYLAKARNGNSWSKRWGLWPFDYAVSLMNEIGSTTVVLVEGQRDALRLLTNDIPAVCIFGTQSWSPNKAKLLELAGVERVVQLFDGDDAGIGATRGTLKDLRELFDVRTVCLWKVKGSPYRKYSHLDPPQRLKAIKADGVELWDPGSCPQWIIDRIKRKFI